MMKQKLITIELEHYLFLKEQKINLSKLVRKLVDELIRNQKIKNNAM